VMAGFERARASASSRVTAGVEDAGWADVCPAASPGQRSRTRSNRACRPAITFRIDARLRRGRGAGDTLGFRSTGAWTVGGPGRELQGEARVFGFGRHALHVTTVKAGHMAGQGQAEPVAVAVRADVRRAVEAVEQSLALRGRDVRARRRHLQPD